MVQVAGGQEYSFAERTRDQGFAIRLPKRYRRGTAKRAEPVPELRFPGYAFALADLAANEHGVLCQVRGYLRMLPHPDRPATLDPALVALWDRLEDREIHAIRHRQTLRGDIHAGDIVACPAGEGELWGTVKGMASVWVGGKCVRVHESALTLVLARGDQSLRLAA